MLRKVSKSVKHLWDAFRELMGASHLYRVTAILSLIFVILTIALPAWKILPRREELLFIPLHYNIYIGIDRFGPWYHAFIPAVLGATLLFVNVIFEAVFFRRERVLSLFFAVATVLAELVLFVSIVLTVLLNLNV